MSIVYTDNQHYSDIADAIRAKNGTNTTYKPEDMASAIGALPTGDLPSGYTAVEYIESTGTQYIDSGYTASNYTDVEMDCYVDSQTPLYYCLFGSYASSRAYQLMGNANNGKMNFYTNSGDYIFTGTYNERITIRTSPIGIEVRSSSSATGFSRTGNHATSYTLGIFAGHESGGFLAGALMRLYEMKIFNNSALVRHFIPCVRDSDEEVGLYELVNGQFYGNDGTGTFNKGADV